MSRLTEIDLSQLPAPTVVEVLDYEQILAELKADLQSRAPEVDLTLESEPLNKLLETAAYRELGLRARVNDGARAVMLAYASGSDLDQIAATYRVARLDGEDDRNLRIRTQLSWEAFTTAGSIGSYEFFARTASLELADVSVTRGSAGQVIVSILGRGNEGQPTAACLQAVSDALNAEEVRPLTDEVLVRPAYLVDFQVEAEIKVAIGPDPVVVQEAAESALDSYLDDRFAIGKSVSRSGIIAALHQPGVQSVSIETPASDIEVDELTVARCTGTAVAYV